MKNVDYSLKHSCKKEIPLKYNKKKPRFISFNQWKTFWQDYIFNLNLYYYFNVFTDAMMPRNKVVK